MSAIKQHIGSIALVVKDYDEAIEFYTKKLSFELVEDTNLGEGKRWVLITPPNSNGTHILLTQATEPEQLDAVGNQAGGRVWLFLNTNDFWRDYERMTSIGIEFIRQPQQQDYGTVAVFKDLYGNLWDLLELNPSHPISCRLS